MKILHIANKKLNQRIWTRQFRREVAGLGELELVEDGLDIPPAKLAEMIRQAEVLLTGWDSAPVPAELAEKPGKLAYICHITGTMRRYIPLELIDSPIHVTNWGDAQDNMVAEAAMTLLLAALKDLHRRIELIRQDGWKADPHTHGGSLEGINVGIYGLGVIGRRFVELLRPFRAAIRVFDPYVEQLPPPCTRAASLEELFDTSQAIVIHAALTDQTRRTVSAELLGKLPKYGVVINTARGGIIDQDALFAELESGRLRAGLDVLEPDYLPPGHPARKWPNLILTAHHAHLGWPDDHTEPTRMEKMHLNCLDNLRRFVEGKPLRFFMDRDRYLRST